MSWLLSFSFIEAAYLWLERGASDLWFETLDMISKNGLVALDNDLKERIANGDCLGAIYKNSKNDKIPSFILTAWSCNDKKAVACEKQPTKFHVANSEQANFPNPKCILQQNNTKSKRETDEYGNEFWSSDGSVGTGTLYLFCIITLFIFWTKIR